MPAETANEADNRPLARFREREQAVGAIADRQHGVVARAQLLKLGFEEGAIARRVAAGRLHEVRRGVYAPGRRALTREGRWMAAVLASGPEAVLSHWSAAALWTEPLDTVENLLREMEFRELWDRLSLPDLIERYPGKRGVRKVRAALGPTRFQVDCHWPNTGQIVELDGWEGHRTRTAFREDRARDRILRVAGYSVTRLTWNQLDDEPEAVAADLRVLLGVGR